MATVNLANYVKYYKGSCLVKFEKDHEGNNYVTEIKVQDGRAFLVTTKNGGLEDEIIEEHELGILDVKPLDLNIGVYGKRKEGDD